MLRVIPSLEPSSTSSSVPSRFSSAEQSTMLHTIPSANTISLVYWNTIGLSIDITFDSDQPLQHTPQQQPYQSLHSFHYISFYIAFIHTIWDDKIPTIDVSTIPSVVASLIPSSLPSPVPSQQCRYDSWSPRPSIYVIISFDSLQCYHWLASQETTYYCTSF